jgi:Fe-S cluster biogenesis protein NfuA
MNTQRVAPETVLDRLRRLVDEHSAGAGEYEPRLEFVSFDAEGIVQVRIPGVGGCCPASALPWVESLESHLKREVAGVRLVEVVP